MKEGETVRAIVEFQFGRDVKSAVATSTGTSGFAAPPHTKRGPRGEI